MTPNSEPIIETERLLLRPTKLEDFDRWTEFVGDERSARFVGGVQAKGTAWRSFLSMAGAWSLTGVAMFSVIEKSTNQWIGRVGPWQPLGWPGTEVGWGLHRDAWGKGYALEAAIASMDYAVDTLGWSDIIHCINPENAPSKALARKLGSTYLRMGTLPAPFEHEVIEIWGQSSAEWATNRAMSKL